MAGLFVRGKRFRCSPSITGPTSRWSTSTSVGFLQPSWMAFLQHSLACVLQPLEIHAADHWRPTRPRDAALHARAPTAHRLRDGRLSRTLVGESGPCVAERSRLQEVCCLLWKRLRVHSTEHTVTQTRTFARPRSAPTPIRLQLALLGALQRSRRPALGAREAQELQSGRAVRVRQLTVTDPSDENARGACPAHILRSARAASATRAAGGRPPRRRACCASR